MKALTSNAVFHVKDLQRALRFYTDVLEFTVDFQFGSPVSYAGLRLGTVALHISSRYPYKDNTGHGHVYIVCDEVDSLYEKILGTGVVINGVLGDQPYGMRDFNIADPDGNQLGFGTSIIG